MIKRNEGLRLIVNALLATWRSMSMIMLHTHIHTYIYTYIHTHTHTYISICRLIKRNEGLRLIVNALLATWRSVSMIMLLAASVAVVFAIIGMQCFKGRFHSCNDDAILFPMGKAECASTYMKPTTVSFRANEELAPADYMWLSQRVWHPSPQNFDTFGNAVLTLAAVNTFEYADVLWEASAGTLPDKSPSADNKAFLAGAFFLTYTITASLFVMNLFVAYIVDGFNQLRKAEAVERRKVAVYKNFYKVVHKSSPHQSIDMPQSRWRVWVRCTLLPSRWLNGFLILCMFVNVSIMALYNDDLNDEWKLLYAMQNHVFFAVMLLEMVLCITGLGWVAYFSDRWVWIDVLSILSSALGYFNIEGTFIRAFRLVRLLRIINTVPALRQMLETLANATKQVANVVLLMVLVFSMYAILFVNMIGSVREGFLRLGSPISLWPADPPNFSSYLRAMATLFQMMTGDQW